MTTTLTETCNEVLNNFIGTDNPLTDDVEQAMLRDPANIQLWRFGQRDPDLDIVDNHNNDARYMEDNRVTEEEVIDYLTRKIKTKRAGGPDEVPGLLLKTVAPAISDYLARIYDDCLRMAYFPALWKRGRLITIPKGTDRKTNDISGWRPLTLLSILGKGMEQVILDRIHKFIEIRDENAEVHAPRRAQTRKRATLDKAIWLHQGKGN